MHQHEEDEVEYGIYIQQSGGELKKNDIHMEFNISVAKPLVPSL